MKGVEYWKKEEASAVFLAKQDWKILTQPNYIWLTVMRAKDLKNSKDFIQVTKTNMSSTTWKNKLDHRCLLKRGSTWILGNE